MNEFCDIFLVTPTQSNSLRFLNLFDKSFFYKKDVEYSGYMGVSVSRINLIPLIDMLRKQAVLAYSVPVDYKVEHLLSKECAFEIAVMHAKNKHKKALMESRLVDNRNPLVWIFLTLSIDENKVDDVIVVDRLDGHIWGLNEFDTYMYDYNNVY